MIIIECSDFQTRLKTRQSDFEKTSRENLFAGKTQNSTNWFFSDLVSRRWPVGTIVIGEEQLAESNNKRVFEKKRGGKAFQS